MPLTVSCTTANREIEGTVNKFLSLLGESKFDRMIDPFCGSGSVILQGMQKNIAKEYLACDVFSPIVDLLESIKVEPEKLLKAYAALCQSPSKFFSVGSPGITALMDQNSDPIKKAAHWLYLVTRLQNNRPVFDGNTLVSPLEPQAKISHAELSNRISEINSLFSSRTVQFKKTNAKILFENLTLRDNDFVFLDPPYPASEDPKQTIFYRSEKDAELFEIVIKIIQQLNKNNVRFIFNYDLFWGCENPHHRKFVVDEKQLKLQHLMLVSHNPSDPEFSTLFEHIYVSENIKLAALPVDVYHYSDIKKLSYEDAKKHCGMQEQQIRSKL